MRHFHSYGPVDARYHFCAERRFLVDQCVSQLVGEAGEGGHYFTIWAARQTGKTWLMRQALQEISKQYGDKFVLIRLSFGWLTGVGFSAPKEDEDAIWPDGMANLLRQDLPGSPAVTSWNGFKEIFYKEGGLWDRPVILLIDEVDTIPSALLDVIVRRFRELYLQRESNWLHGLALIGVRAVLGIESQRGSPFNIQRSLHVPNLTQEELIEMYRQYQMESGQAIEPTVVEKVYEVTRGQPGLVSWFGELLTETYNPGRAETINLKTWDYVWVAARFIEPNNTVMNLIAKARMVEYQEFLLKLFRNADMPFYFHDPLHNHMYMHGLVEPRVSRERNDELVATCRFTSPFIQDCIYQALGRELVSQSETILPLEPLDMLSDVFDPPSLNLPALLQRYKEYLIRLKARGINPWKAQPRRDTDYQLTEAVGHFHLYAWLQQAIGRRSVVSPEFPTGNGKVDLHIRYDAKRGLIEVKSFVDAYQLNQDKPKAAHYATQVGLSEVTMAVFIPILDDEILNKLSTVELHAGVQVTVVMIGWF